MKKTILSKLDGGEKFKIKEGGHTYMVLDDWSGYLWRDCVNLNNYKVTSFKEDREVLKLKNKKG